MEKCQYINIYYGTFVGVDVFSDVVGLEEQLRRLFQISLRQHQGPLQDERHRVARLQLQGLYVHVVKHTTH